ncbi:MAG: cytochrome c peroxidase [Myxococcota bacterium]
MACSIPLAASLLGLAGCSDLSSIDNVEPDDLQPEQRARFELGRDLFFDPGLSAAGDVSCATCHQPTLYGTDARPTSEGTQGRVGRRNAPSVFNAALKERQFWDGRAPSLAEQALGPLFAFDEMHQTEAGLLEYVQQAYGERFELAFEGQQSPSAQQVGEALAAYQELLPRRSRLDRFIDGERDALDREERRGFRLFERNCSFCHQGAGVGGTGYERLGEEVPWPADRSDDQGLFEVTGDPADRMRFFVPSLRNVAQTGPWFHDGSVESLDEAVTLMARHQLGRTFSGPQRRALVAFLRTLDAESIPDWVEPGDSD